jgi:hypothetical protein
MYARFFIQSAIMAVVAMGAAAILAVMMHQDQFGQRNISKVISGVLPAKAQTAQQPADPNAGPPLSEIKPGGLEVYADKEAKGLIGQVKKTAGQYQKKINEDYKNAYKAVGETPPPIEYLGDEDKKNK